MIPRECRRLAEVDFPIAEVSKHAAREKSIRHGHPSTLHLWWARRPLASSRAVLLGLLLPDPCDPHCPKEFKAGARRLLPQVVGEIGPGDDDLRAKLLTFIGHFANWDLAANRAWVDVGRALVKAAHGDEPPLVTDPFAGGGSIPLEALRLGCEAFASDLNPVACLILKVMLEDIPRHGPKLAEELRKVGDEINRQAERENWRTSTRPTPTAQPRSPTCGRARCVARRRTAGRKFHSCGRSGCAGRPCASGRCGIGSSGPKARPRKSSSKCSNPRRTGTCMAAPVARARATCLCCGAVLPPERVRTQLAAQRGGADVVFDERGRRTGGARMTAVVTLRPGETGRHYRLPMNADYEAVRRAQKRLASILDEWERNGRQGLCPVPDEPLPPIGTLGFRVQRYGMLQWDDLFTARQKVALATLTRLIRDPQIAGTLTSREALGAVLSRCVDHWSAGAMWIQDLEAVAHTFGRQALPIVWDFVESCGFGKGGAVWQGQVKWIARVIEMSSSSRVGTVQITDAADCLLPTEIAGIWFTDPPYYDAIPYSDLSDFFFVWLKRIFPDHPLLRDPFNPDNILTPKIREAVQDETKHDDDGQPKGRAWFEKTMAKTFSEGRRVLSEDGVGSVVFAHKTTEGWEALLSGLIDGGWTITGSWPLSTERPVRLRSFNSAALATSVHLICRPRPEDALVGDWADVLRERPNRVADWMERLQAEGIRGADLVFACIGPALEIFSRHPRVETADGRDVGLPEYLEKVWEVVGRAALEQVLGAAEAGARNGGLAGALEEDARLTALFLWTIQSTDVPENGRRETEEKGEDVDAVAKVASRGISLPFDVVRRFAQPMGIDLDAWTGRIIDQEKGVVRLLPVAERAGGLFGKDGAGAAADWIESDLGTTGQGILFPELDAAPKTGRRHRGTKSILDGDAELQTIHATTLDRVHAAMLLQASGHANALRTLIGAEQERGPDFLRLANALSALYPTASQEKRLLDAMLLAVPR